MGCFESKKLQNSRHSELRKRSTQGSWYLTRVFDQHDQQQQKSLKQRHLSQSELFLRQFNLNQETKAFFQPLFITENEKKENQPPVLLREYDYLHKTGALCTHDYAFLVQGYIIIKTVNSCSNPFVGSSDCLRREVLIRNAIRQLERKPYCCQYLPCLHSEHRRNILYKEETWVQWAYSTFVCLPLESPRHSNVDVEVDVDGDDVTSHCCDDLTSHHVDTDRECQNCQGGDHKSTAHTYMDMMKRELAVKHRDIKLQKKYRYKRHIKAWRNRVTGKTSPLFVRRECDVGPTESSANRKPTLDLNKKADRSEFIRRKRKLIKARYTESTHIITYNTCTHDQCAYNCCVYARDEKTHKMPRLK